MDAGSKMADMVEIEEALMKDFLGCERLRVVGAILGARAVEDSSRRNSVECVV